MIREATLEDIDFLIVMGKKFFDEAKLDESLKFDPETLEGVLKNLIENDMAAIFVDDKLRGCIGGVIYPHYFTGQNAGSELFWYVEPEHRKGIGQKLLSRLEEWVSDKKGLSLTMISLENSSAGIMNKIYKKRGYQAREHHYVKYMN